MRETVIAVSLLAATASAQEIVLPEVASEFVTLDRDSGWLDAPRKVGDLVYETELAVPGASALRVSLDGTELPRGLGEMPGATLVITSLADGASQFLDATSIEQWGGTSAYFNGDAVRVELFSPPASALRRANGSAESRPRLRIDGALATFGPRDTRTICGSTDDRELSYDNRQGRYLPAGCTSWLIGPNCLLSAAHCVRSNEVIEFNVPLSTPSGDFQHPPPEDQYAVDPASKQFPSPYSLGNDWVYFGVFPNSNTGLVPTDAYGEGVYEMADSAPPVNGQQIRITGYGSTQSGLAPLEWYLVQKTHVGDYVSRSGTQITYTADTTGGNSGGPVIDESTGMVIGIHTNGGCGSFGGSNLGTSIENAQLQNALANPLGVCRQADCNDNGVNDFDEILDGVAFDCNGNGVLDQCEIADGAAQDCNGNGVPDDCEFFDCNNNGIMDECEIAMGMAVDCNANGVPDACDIVDASITRGSGRMGPVVFGSRLSSTYSGLAPASTPVFFFMDALFDMGLSSEMLTVFVDGREMGTFFNTSLEDCPNGPLEAVFTIDEQTFNRMIGEDGAIVIAIDPSSTVNDICADSWVEVRLAYESPAVSTDEDNDGIPDECFVACDADVTATNANPGDKSYGVPDGTVDVSDLSWFVEHWAAGDVLADVSTEPSNPGDEDYGVSDGSVTTADLTYFVENWLAGCP
ncbi:MAG: GC-type dockerin domain-anchored protein [Planctomycetota bacterium]